MLHFVAKIGKSAKPTRILADLTLLMHQGDPEPQKSGSLFNGAEGVGFVLLGLGDA